MAPPGPAVLPWCALLPRQPRWRATNDTVPRLLLSLAWCLLVVVAAAIIASSAGGKRQCPERRPRSLGDRCHAFRTRQLPTSGPDGPSDDWVLRDPVPPSLISQAGAGNTMVRLLLDYATGLYSGVSMHLLSPSPSPAPAPAPVLLMRSWDHRTPRYHPRVCCRVLHRARG